MVDASHASWVPDAAVTYQALMHWIDTNTSRAGDRARRLRDIELRLSAISDAVLVVSQEEKGEGV